MRTSVKNKEDTLLESRRNTILVLSGVTGGTPGCSRQGKSTSGLILVLPWVPKHASQGDTSKPPTMTASKWKCSAMVGGVKAVNLAGKCGSWVIASIPKGTTRMRRIHSVRPRSGWRRGVRSRTGRRRGVRPPGGYRAHTPREREIRGFRLNFSLKRNRRNSGLGLPISTGT